MHGMPYGPRPVLTAAQRCRLAKARRSLAASRVADLTALDAAGSILMIESLRSALDEALCLLQECSN